MGGVTAREKVREVAEARLGELVPVVDAQLQQFVQSDTVMIDAPSIYDQQLAAMVRQVQGASANQ